MNDILHPRGHLAAAWLIAASSAWLRGDGAAAMTAIEFASAWLDDAVNCFSGAEIAA